MNADTIDKIVQKYFAVVTLERFEYKGMEYFPQPLRISPGLQRGFVCPPYCGGCCFNFTLDYLPHEEHPYELEPRTVAFDGRDVTIYSDCQLDNDTNACRNLRFSDGRCMIHGRQPFSCDFELIRFSISNTSDPNVINTQLFGRGWSFKRTDGGRGARCYLTQANEEECQDVARRLKRLEEWAHHFGLTNTMLPYIIEYAETGPHAEGIMLNTGAFSNVRDGHTLFFD